MVLPSSSWRHRLSSVLPPRQAIGRYFLQCPRRVLAAVLFGLSLGLAWFGFVRRGLPAQGPCGGETHDDNNDCVKEVSTEVTEGEGAGVVHGKRPAGPGQDAGSVKRPRTEEEEDVDEEEFEGGEYVVDDSDEFYCEYDSTWEMQRSRSQRSRSQWSDRPTSSSNYKFSRFRNAARDMQNYREDYPQKKTRYRQRNQEEYHMANLDFYLRKQPSYPDGIYIDEFHNEWFQDYYKLESVHTFIQWLFPLQEPGVNYEAVELTKKEIEAFRENEVAKANLLKSYELMLDFYGIELSDVKTGEVQRASNWEKRFANLNRNTHNNQRITRILKCLGTLGFSHYQAPLVRFFLHETLVNEVLPAVKESVLNYFLFAVLDKKRRRSLIKFAFQNYKPRGDFVWCPRKIQAIWSSTDAQFPQSSQAIAVRVDEGAEKIELVSDVNLHRNKEHSSSREPVETGRYADMNKEPTNQSERSLPSQHDIDMPAEPEEIAEDVNPQPTRVPSADATNGEKRESVSDVNLHRDEERSSSREPVETGRYEDVNKEPTNQSECSLPSQHNMPAEPQENGEDVNPQPIRVPSAADGSNDTCPRKIQMTWSTDAQLSHSSQNTAVCVDERAENWEFVPDVNLHRDEERSSSREPVETGRYADEEPPNQSERSSLPSQHDMPAELEETAEDVNPQPIRVPTADGSNDEMAE